MALELARRVGGQGYPVVLVHGYTGSKEDFTYVAPALAREWRVVSYDHRGHGESPKPAGQEHYTLDLLADDLDGIIAAMGPAHLVGHSMGGVVVQRYLARYGTAQVGRVVLFDTLYRGGRSPEHDRNLRIAEARGMAALADDLDGANPPNPVLDALPDVAAFLRNRFRTMSADAYVALGRELARLPDTRPGLAAVARPVLVLCGAADTSTPPASNRTLAAAIPGARYVEIDGAGHTPQVENPGAWLDAVVSFLSS